MPLVELGYMKRRVIVVDGPLSFRMRRLEAARACTVGLEILSLPLLAARLAGASVASRVPSKALNDAILDASIFHVVKNRSGVFASGMSILPRSSSKRMPPKTSSMYSISRALCSDGMRCIKPLSSSRNDTNSLRVNGGATGQFSEYAPQVAGIKRLPAYTCQLSGFGFCGGWCLGSPPGERRISGLR